MTDSTRDDAKRSRLRERIKRTIVSQFDAALAGGAPQVRYIRELGLPDDRIFTPYDVVDNDFFARGAAAVRSDPGGCRHLPGLASGSPFFLASGRFIERKNFGNLIKAYGAYRSLDHDGAPWELVILGDGPERSHLAALADAIAPGSGITFPGYRQINEITAYYGLAGAFVHPAKVEPWGLVVNEAMAAGLPVLVSRSAGAAEDLVSDGVNGFRFDPGDPVAIAIAMLRVSASDADREEMGRQSVARIALWTPERFAEGLWRAVAAGTMAARRGLPHSVRILLWASQLTPRSVLAWRSVEP